MNKTIALAPPDWPLVLQLILRDDPRGLTDLYQYLMPIRWALARRIGAERAADLYHDLIVVLIAQIQAGHLREATSLPAYAKRIAFRKLTDTSRGFAERLPCSFEEWMLPSADPSPEAQAIRSEQEAIATAILRALPERDREVLIRFYLNGEPKEQIQTEMGISETQFRSVKSRAKGRFDELCRSRTDRKEPGTAVAWPAIPRRAS